MQGYTACEDAVVTRLISKFSELDADNCIAGDVDSVLTYMLENDLTTGCYVDYGGGEEDLRKPFTIPIWFWRVVGIFMIRKTDDNTIEADLRSILDRLALLFYPDHTLNGITARARISEIGDADTVDIEGMPFYWLPFVAEVIDRD